MNKELLLQHFDRISEAPDAIPRLRRFILDLVVRGKLVDQDPNDEPPVELLKRIQTEKARLLKVGEIRKQKSLLPIGKDSVPSVSPASWMWERLGNLSTVITKGSTPTSYGHAYTESGINFIKVESIKTGLLLSKNVTSFISEGTHNFLRRSQLETGDILFSIAGSIGTCAVVTQDVLPANTNQALAIIRGTQSVYEPAFLLSCIQSSVSQVVLDKARGGAMNNVSLEDIQNFIVPLPPLAEQHRIVAKVDELMALCDQLQAERNKCESRLDRLVASSLNRISTTTAEEAKDATSFHLNYLPRLTTRTEHIKQLRQTILNLAARGRLVPQDPNDEPAAELLKRIQVEKARLVKEGVQKKEAALPALDLEQAPFSLPVGWSWARFPELGKFGRGKSKHRPRNDSALFAEGTHLLVQTGDVARSQGVIKTYTSKYNDIGLAQSMKWPSGSLCITIAANIADSGILSFDACFPDSVVGFIPATIFPNARYFEYFVRTAKANLLAFAPATAQKNINLEILNAVMIPLPPLAEQNRIVARIDELMALCDQLESQLNTTDADSRRLLEAVLRDALDTSALVS